MLLIHFTMTWAAIKLWLRKTGEHWIVECNWTCFTWIHVFKFFFLLWLPLGMVHINQYTRLCRYLCVAIFMSRFNIYVIKVNHKSILIVSLVTDVLDLLNMRKAFKAVASRSSDKKIRNQTCSANVLYSDLENEGICPDVGLLDGSDRSLNRYKASDWAFYLQCTIQCTSEPYLCTQR